MNTDTLINLLDKNDEKVGLLNLVKNDEENFLSIQFVKVPGDEENNTYNERTFTPLSSSAFDIIKTNLKNRYFSQALIKPEILPIKELIINTDYFASKDLITLKFQSNGKKGIPNHKKGFDDELYNEFRKKWGEFSGIIVFLSAIQQSGIESGHAKPYPRDNNYLIISPMSITHSLTIAHEIAHALGLPHSWDSNDLYKDRVSAIEDKQKQINEWLNNYKDYPDNTKIGNTTRTLSHKIKDYKDWLEKLEKEKNDKIELSAPLHAFNKISTENIMDYNGYRTTDGEIISNPFSEDKSFWQWQCKMIINEVKKYHGR